MLQHLLWRVPICHQFPNTEQYRILLSHQSTLVYEPKRSATMMCFYDTQTRSLSQNGRSRLVGHCATQLKLEGWNLMDTTVNSERTVKTIENCAQGILTETMEKSHHPSLDSVPHWHQSSQVLEVHKLSKVFLRICRLGFVISWRNCAALSRNVKSSTLSNFCTTTLKLASRFKFVILITNLQSNS